MLRYLQAWQADINSCTLATLLLSAHRIAARLLGPGYTCNKNFIYTYIYINIYICFFFGISRCFFAFYKQIHKNKSLVGHVGASGLVSAILPQAQTHTYTQRERHASTHALTHVSACVWCVCVSAAIVIVAPGYMFAY